MGTFLVWQICERTVGRPWMLRLPGGVQMRCYPHSRGATGVLYCRLPEWEDMNFSLDYLRPGDGFIDVGANVGVYSLFAASIPDVQIWAFEPSSDTFARLRENVELNSLQSRVVLISAAVGSAAGRVAVSTGQDTVNRVLPAEAADESEEVPIVSLDEAIGGPEAAQIHLVKIDVEGFEEQVLLGAPGLLAASRPVLIIEANDPAAIRDALVPFGYSSYSYDPHRRRLTETGWLEERGNNILAIHDRALVERRLLEARGPS